MFLVFVGMSSYPDMLTPPSSSEDSPQGVFYVASPNSNSFQGPESYTHESQVYAPQPQIGYDIAPKNEVVAEPTMLMDVQSKHGL